ncbi:hypothetical protein PPL_12015 [Heterostelium album PN500]|uniref:Uncharacterized protein n=1 Tax=Heterostelium pallidum (strain ATCC 26659 / Pp 5 / PN500) TaxID=670386 RepID=D3BV43_HETP5|nr:hypothetical protein PPL_12015 [Heterostelium album PN500]EFA74981.1 hypothetical protein PPL_12015 [Heterostelium album PN500]|eukprot:XP_020427115.1 hypothetical protein PPL_12015 [Heterostelium album PN500]
MEEERDKQQQQQLIFIKKIFAISPIRNQIFEEVKNINALSFLPKYSWLELSQDGQLLDSNQNDIRSQYLKSIQSELPHYFVFD